MQLFKKGLGIVIAAAALLVIASPFGSSAADNSSAPPNDQSSQASLGSELAASLGLSLQPHFPDEGCQFYVEVENPAGYCLDAVGSSKEDRYIIAKRLQGTVPSDAEMSVWEAADHVGNMSSTDPGYPAAEQAFRDALNAYQAQQPPSSGSK